PWSAAGRAGGRAVEVGVRPAAQEAGGPVQPGFHRRPRDAELVCALLVRLRELVALDEDDLQVGGQLLHRLEDDLHGLVIEEVLEGLLRPVGNRQRLAPRLRAADWLRGIRVFAGFFHLREVGVGLYAGCSGWR